MTESRDAGPASTRILGLVEGDPSTALSGVARFLFDALDERLSVVERLDYSPHGIRRLALAAATFHPSRATWRARFHTSRLAHRTLSSVLRHRLASAERDFDLALQVHGWVRGQPRPYALFVDQTRLMAERGWPRWLPLPSRERAELLALEREMYQGAFHVFVMGSPARDSLIHDYDVDPAAITIAGGGVCFERLPAPAGPSPDPAVLFVGREFQRKGGADLIAAFEQVRSRLPDAVLHVVGPSRREVGGPGVVAHGRVSDRARIAELYRGARLLCLPSHYEPFGLVLLEAMAHGVPCVATNVQSIPEILDEGRAGLLVSPGELEALAEAMIRLLTDDDLAREIGAAGRRRVERQFTWDRVAERMAPVLSRATGGSPSAPVRR